MWDQVVGYVGLWLCIVWMVVATVQHVRAEE